MNYPPCVSPDPNLKAVLAVVAVLPSLSGGAKKSVTAATIRCVDDCDWIHVAVDPLVIFC